MEKPVNNLSLSTLERIVLDKLLARKGRVFELLRTQLEGAHVTRREFTGCGFYTYLKVAKSAPPIECDKGNLEISGVVATIDGLEHGAGFVLFVRDGYLDNLEGFTYDEPWPEKVHNVCLNYT